jgi:hypothetical protein
VELPLEKTVPKATPGPPHPSSYQNATGAYGALGWLLVQIHGFIQLGFGWLWFHYVS